MRCILNNKFFKFDAKLVKKLHICQIIVVVKALCSDMNKNTKWVLLLLLTTGIEASCVVRVVTLCKYHTIVFVPVILTYLFFGRKSNFPP